MFLAHLLERKRWIFTVALGLLATVLPLGVFAEGPMGTVWVADEDGNSLTVATVKTGKGSHGVAIDKSSTLAYVTNTFDNTVSVMDIAKRKVRETVKVGKKPNGITFAPAR